MQQNYKITIFMAIFVLLANMADAQMLGAKLGLARYIHSEENYNSVEYRNAPRFEVYYRHKLSDNFSFKIGHSGFERIADIEYSFSPAKVHENCLAIFTAIEASQAITEKTSFVYGLGVNFATIQKQKVLFPHGTTIPANVEIKEGELFGYSKFGLVADISIIHEINPKMSILASLGSLLEFDKLSINKDDCLELFYSSMSLNVGFEVKFGKKNKS